MIAITKRKALHNSTHNASRNWEPSVKILGSQPPSAYSAVCGIQHEGKTNSLMYVLIHTFRHRLTKRWNEKPQLNYSCNR